MAGNPLGKNKVNLTVSIHVDEMEIIKALVRESREGQSDLVRGLYLEGIRLRWPQAAEAIETVRARQFDAAQAQHISDLPIKDGPYDLSSVLKHVLAQERDPGLAMVESDSPESEQKHKAGGTIVHKSGRVGGGRRDRGGQPEAPKPVLK